MMGAVVLALACSSSGEKSPAVTAPPGGSSTPTPTPPVTTTPATVTIAVNAGTGVNAAAPRLLGISFDGRSSLTLSSGGTPVGYHDPTTGAVYSGVAPLWNDFPITTVRYPGNAVNQGMNWKLAIGPLASRAVQTLQGAQPQRIAFGFDEFMAMAAAQGAAARDVQIMVIIYPTSTEPNPAQSAADFVEYANAPNDGSNPGGGTDWAAVRAANGHAAPYGIRIWNIGNEPWAPGEFNFQPAPYLAIAVPIIDAMRAIDPTIQITLPAVGPATSTWNAAMLSAPQLEGKIYGLSPHAFYDDVGTPTPAQVESTIRSVAAAAQAKGWRIVLGDHAHDIASTSSPTQAQKELAMQWQGAVTTAHFLAMLSQVPNIERANFWIYGAPAASWAPIRRNTNGSYSLLAVAQLYKTLRPVFHEQVLATTVASV
ncbi:MAG: hypothetical protein Q8K55_06285, partial [Gemmatimonadaceae bacterium]|nr:hypothetical protein [Gemmatimonadaceae bacterium]